MLPTQRVNTRPCCCTGWNVRMIKAIVSRNTLKNHSGCSGIPVPASEILFGSERIRRKIHHLPSTICPRQGRCWTHRRRGRGKAFPFDGSRKTRHRLHGTALLDIANAGHNRIDCSSKTSCGCHRHSHSPAPLRQRTKTSTKPVLEGHVS